MTDRKIANIAISASVTMFMILVAVVIVFLEKKQVTSNEPENLSARYLERFENEEVICYGYKDHAKTLQCKWKDLKECGIY